MTENQSNDVQDPAEQYKVEEAVQTEPQPVEVVPETPEVEESTENDTDQN